MEGGRLCVAWRRVRRTRTQPCLQSHLSVFPGFLVFNRLFLFLLSDQIIFGFLTRVSWSALADVGRGALGEKDMSLVRTTDMLCNAKVKPYGLRSGTRRTRKGWSWRWLPCEHAKGSTWGGQRAGRQLQARGLTRVVIGSRRRICCGGQRGAGVADSGCLALAGPLMRKPASHRCCTQPALSNIALLHLALSSAPSFKVTEPDRFWPRSQGFLRRSMPSARVVFVA